MEYHLVLNSLNDTKRLAHVLAMFAAKGTTILLYGDLGAGKTTFAQFFIKSLLGENANVTSPTFNILNIYEKPGLQIYHYDFYRVKNKEEIFELALDEALESAIVLVEWPQLIENNIHNNKIVLYFEATDHSIKITLKLDGVFLKKKQLHEMLGNL